jgi:MraZ protein
LAFRGTFDYTLDVKNRLTVPAKFRPSLEDGAVLAKGIERCVALWRPPDYERHTASMLEHVNPLRPERRQLSRFFQANAYDIELDSAGRVMIPAKLVEYAGLAKDVVVAGAGDCLEIWDREAWHGQDDDVTDRILDITAGLGSSS